MNPATHKNIDHLMCNNYNDVKSAVVDLRNILIGVAEKVLRKKHPKTNKHIKNKPWFDKSLQILRRELSSKARLLCRFPNDPHVRGGYFTLLKKYNKSRKYKQRLHKQEIIDKLETMKSNKKPTEFWKVLEDLRVDDRKDNPATHISLFEWSEYFKELNCAQSGQHEYLKKTVNNY
jgi:hypothetical protein